MHSLCGTPDDLQPFDLTILCATAWTQCPAQGSLGALTAPRCKTTLNPNLHLNCSEGRKTLHSSAVTHLAPRTSSSTHESRILTKPTIQSPIEACCHPSSSTPALSGENAFPQYLRHFVVFFNSSTLRGVMGHKLLRKYKFPS